MHFLVLLISTAVVAGCFLPWSTPTLFAISLRGINTRDGQIVLAAAMTTALVALSNILKKKNDFPGLYIAGGLTGSIISGLDLFTPFGGFFYRSPAPGIFLVAGGSVLVTLMGVFPLVKRNRTCIPLERIIQFILMTGIVALLLLIFARRKR